ILPHRARSSRVSDAIRSRIFRRSVSLPSVFIDDRKTLLFNAHFNFKLFVVHLRDTTTPGMSPDPRGHMRTHLVLTAVIFGALSSAADTSPFYVPIRK